MENSNVTFFEILKIPHAELYQIKGDDVNLLERGNLQVIHSHFAELFALKVGGYKFALDEALEVIGAASEKAKYPTYLFPGVECYYMIKIIDSKHNNLPALTNLDTILTNTSKFITKTGFEKRLGALTKRPEGTMGTIREGLHKIGEAFRSIQIAESPNPNNRFLKSFEELQKVDSQSAAVIDVSILELQLMRNEVAVIVGHHQEARYWLEYRDWDGEPYGEEEDLFNQTTEPSNPLNQPLDIPKENPFDKFTQQQQQQRSQGADNISTRKIEHASECHITTVKSEHVRDSQEIIGAENQRLPSYEVHTSKEAVGKGFDQASCNLGEKNPEQAEPVRKPEPEIDEEEYSMTIGLLCGPLPEAYRRDMGIDQPFSNMDEGGDMASEPLGENALTKFPSEVEAMEKEKGTVEGESKQPLGAGGDIYRKNMSSTQAEYINTNEQMAPSVQEELRKEEDVINEELSEEERENEEVEKEQAIEEMKRLKEDISHLSGLKNLPPPEESTSEKQRMKKKAQPAGQQADKENVGEGYIV